MPARELTPGGQMWLACDKNPVTVATTTAVPACRSTPDA
jgi:hypothetical protein